MQRRDRGCIGRPRFRQHGLAAPQQSRDLRLDFFRGLALIFIFIDHIPGNVMSNLTVHTIAFSNAAEIFIFISGYTAALVYGQLLMRRGPLFATVQVYHRVWQLYVAHVFIFIVYTAEVSYAISTTRAQSLSEELRLNEFLREPPRNVETRFARLDDIVCSERLYRQRRPQHLRRVKEKRDSP